jgi:hypothetical protein
VNFGSKRRSKQDVARNPSTIRATSISFFVTCRWFLSVGQYGGNWLASDELISNDKYPESNSLRGTDSLVTKDLSPLENI